MAKNIPIGWYLDAKDKYTCMCRNFRTLNREDIQLHVESNGYCRYGLKCNGENDYECICGRKYTGEKASINVWNHVEDQLEGKLSMCMKKCMSYCHKCKLQLQSVAAYKLHCETKSHLEPREDKCMICNVIYQGKKQKETHLASAKHKQRSEEGTLPLTCDICQITCNGQKQMKAHLETNKHKKRLVKNES